MTLDFSPLSQTVTKEDIKAYEASVSAETSSRYSKKLFKNMIPVAIIFAAYLLIQAILSGIHFRTYPLAILLLIGSIVIGVLFLFIQARKRDLAQLHKFAVTNKAHLIADQANPNYAGAIFEEGYGRIIKEALVFSDGKEIGNYEYSQGSGRNKQTYRWGYMRIKLVRRLPHMLLDAKANNFFGKAISNLPASFSKNQTIKLEGTFNDYFTLYAPADYGQDAFYVFTPDVMAALIDYGEHYDMEVIDDQLLFYANKPFRLNSEESLRQAFTVLDTISNELIDQTDYYADARTGNRAANIIAEPGRRLKSQRNITIVAVVVIAIIIWQVSGMIRMYLQFN